ncbi:GIY-YIG nuclease family protein [Mesorhizobium opportunistum]|uniref:GIY-YIG nuclease family protein n=1 Tax=Mesorhizobium opportunistum TaxID=593909 RepID=A0ABV1YPG7_9HYPH|nr:GIY-YIG nuclease family protein [Mesorhizobium sp.]TIN96388.1 MAG: GIY-YIG nuclease family protein [Mesorhizobium sp.]TJU98062.1 MAG: GIY-YIG nuclease family protein [Mesorhizobium sp.]TJV14096.1 MAG: GIY-YIG nuclease family protein [Mesorhizobium sp.]
MTQLTADTLLNLGFKDIAVWVALSDGIDYRLDGLNEQADTLLLDEPNSLYAFVSGDQVKYIGKTARSIRKRFVGYRKPHPGQRTNWRCHNKIQEILRRDEALRILIFSPISYLRYGDFEINLAAGLEDSLIAEFNPPWNGSERGRPVTEEAEREKAEEDVSPAGASPEIPDVLPTISVADGPARVIASFQIILGEAYYHQGLINPGVEASSHLGKDGDPITIAFGDGIGPVTSRINRTANKTGAVRAVGRNRFIAQWFQKHFNKGDTVDARVLGPHSILLLPKPVGQ